VNGVLYSGKKGPDAVRVVAGSMVTWRSNATNLKATINATGFTNYREVMYKGFRVCGVDILPSESVHPSCKIK
jgi:hypothetical protein